MTLAEAVTLISTDRISKIKSQEWADLGCGNGLFSKALISILPPRSRVYAVDQRPFKFSHPQIKFIKSDFASEELTLPILDGIMMINSIHYIKDKLPFIQQLKTRLLPDGIFVLGEYEISKGNQWVPYPLTFSAATALFQEAGFSSIEKIHDHPSVLNSSSIYSAAISK
ncbi:MAG: class I SAM-dependent methyltransferase [Cyclobacteriaceae bacterium]|nr:class I SAM-dependent methyltransferase [Cyclobacteriaceae bacterium]